MTSTSQRWFGYRILLGTGAFALLIAVGCSSPDTGSKGNAGSAGSAPRIANSEQPDVLAVIDGEPVTLSEVEEAAGDRLAAMDFQYRSQRYQLIDATLKTLVRERLIEEEASARGMSSEELLQEEMNVAVTEDEVERWYQQNRARVGNRSLEQTSGQIQQFLVQQKREGVVDVLASELEKRKNVVYHLEPLRIDFDVSDSPAKGPGEAAITLVEFSDFECSFCGRFIKTLDEVNEKYGDQVRLVFRQFPLSMHPNAQKASEASLCAHDQGKFWPMHDLLFQEQSKLGLVDLKDKASRLGLDRGEFDSCLDSGRYEDKVKKDMQDGASAGVSGTPALFINGIPLPGGALPYEAVSKAIDEELARIEAR
jgi:protein-disulfide isomerase